MFRPLSEAFIRRSWYSVQYSVLSWSQATVIDREPERFTRWIKEAIHIRKEGQHEP